MASLRAISMQETIFRGKDKIASRAKKAFLLNPFLFLVWML